MDLCGHDFAEVSDLGGFAVCVVEIQRRPTKPLCLFLILRWPIAYAVISAGFRRHCNINSGG